MTIVLITCTIEKPKEGGKQQYIQPLEAARMGKVNHFLFSSVSSCGGPGVSIG
jgi:hypothetical protein